MFFLLLLLRLQNESINTAQQTNDVYINIIYSMYEMARYAYHSATGSIHINHREEMRYSQLICLSQRSSIITTCTGHIDTSVYSILSYDYVY